MLIPPGLFLPTGSDVRVGKPPASRLWPPFSPAAALPLRVYRVWDSIRAPSVTASSRAPARSSRVYWVSAACEASSSVFSASPAVGRPEAAAARSANALSAPGRWESSSTCAGPVPSAVSGVRRALRRAAANGSPASRPVTWASRLSYALASASVLAARMFPLPSTARTWNPSAGISNGRRDPSGCRRVRHSSIPPARVAGLAAPEKACTAGGSSGTSGGRSGSSGSPAPASSPGSGRSRLSGTRSFTAPASSSCTRRRESGSRGSSPRARPISSVRRIR
ncbi:hypothetical protein AN220_17570 [Streptomyces nanshensis]|nr:hypothetical protein AN220_17570 [Streptomyces nanshensis]